ncbi:helix-turn-helix transcriptional regulator [Capillimicrobium parvum]|uniref:HTH-type transcriptional activator RhaS n=1 Tax=Capillimicrobium parvum TaxID=2884022 RepID=A0A9E6XUQ3_9ACTN|nr:AraC family transcriptional regulator [Capillimicrobium parvum]UGS34448.1 HTH-type transcriptional activator RhaS [Capillimicrobium parvum]
MASTGLTVDRLDVADGVAVLQLRDWGEDEPVREPHRHDYHELIWVAAGSGCHRIDGERVPARPGTVMLIGRGQVHVFEEARGLDATVIRFRDEVVLEGAPGWMLAGRGGRVVPVTDADGARLRTLAGMLRAELERPADARSAEIARHLVSVALLWFERWYDATRTEARDADDAEVQLHRRFARLLETDFAAHHDARHYADALGVPASTLSRALTDVTGHGTKELILDRVMLEAARLLRYTERTVGEVAHRVGYGDQLYFSRAFKRRFGESPLAYRALTRGKSMHR